MSSLVAYDSSDDSDSNDAGDIEETQNSSAVKQTEKVEPQTQSQVPHSVSTPTLATAPGQEKSISDQAPKDSVQLQTSGQTADSASGQQKLNVAPKTKSPLESSKSENLAAVSSSTSTTDPHISDDDDDFMLEQNRDGGNAFGLRLPPPKASTTAAEGLVGGTSTENGTAPGSSLFAKLPAPKTDPTTGTSSILGLPQPKPASSPSSISDDTLEDMVKPKPAELELAAKLKPPGKKKTKQPVKITIPALPDADSDEDEPKSKRPKASEGKSGLFSLLPAPMHAPKKETNRKLIPHTLTRKPATASAPPRKPPQKAPQGLKPSGKTGTLPGIPGIQQDNDSDDEDGGSSSSNFFSLGSDSEKAALAASSYTVTSSISSLPPVSSLRVNNPTPELEGPQSTATQDSTITSSGPLPSASLLLDSAGSSKMDAPLQFKSSFNPAAPPVGAWSGQSQGYHNPGVSATHSAEAANQDYYTNQQYNYANLNEEDYPEVPQEPSEELGPDGQDMDMEQLFRLQGKKRSGKEHINIIDVHADDHVTGLDLTKTLTEETDMMSHSKKKNKDMPSSQQKRKHQITYLAFKAKERELALKNQWAENRSSRKQTQAKYGF